MAGTSGELSASLAERMRRMAGDADVVVAMGGGADSAALLAVAVDALAAGRVRAVFVHHRLEGSDLLAKAAEGTAVDLGVEFTMLDAPVEDGSNLEARARAVRYEAIESHVDETAVVMTAHTRDDQAETVIMRMASGAGSRGLRGIPSRRGRWRRPFLDVSREALADFAAERGLTVADDPANDDPRFTRSRVRHDVLPVLESHLPGDVRAGLARSATLVGRDDELLDELADEIRVHAARASVSIDAAPIATAPPPIAARAIQRGLRTLLDGRPGTSADVEAVVEAARTGVTHALTAGLVAVNEGPRIWIGRQGPAPPDPIDLEVGRSFAWLSDHYSVTRLPSPPTMLDGGRFTALSDASVTASAVVRAAQPGDRIDIGQGTTAVAELLRVHGVGRERRFVSPLIVDGAKIAAVVGVRTAAWAKPERGRPVIVIEREVTT